ncbi:CHAT domain-containing protein [Pseudoalteromonas xiamenensis]|uniref:CHAT domain-containing protein n=1 Tax=Pseudoalteromonas xiamenensis TaxID=882626 RepID=UPI001FCAD96B|nr:CHAT domain-containing protein [Pseudoalteromonas xiamenensis]
MVTQLYLLKTCQKLMRLKVKLRSSLYVMVLILTYHCRETLYVGNSDVNINSKYKCKLDEVNHQRIASYIYEISNELSELQVSYISKLRELYEDDTSNHMIDSDCIFNRSIFTEANLIALSSLRLDYEFERYRYEYSEEDILKTINVINLIRKKISENKPSDIILRTNSIVISDMSVNLDLQVNESEYTQNALKNKGFDDPVSLEKTIKLVQRNGIDEKTKRSQYIDLAYNERNLIEVLIGIYLSSNIMPCAKIPLSNSDLYSVLKDIGINDRNHNQKGLKRKYINLRKVLHNFTQEAFEYLSERNSSMVKVVSNLPIEWAYHNGLPLMVRHTVSRFPVSPGWLANKVILDTSNIHIDMNSFSNILVISSFRDDDIIKEHLSSKIELFNTMPFNREARDKKFKVNINRQEPSNREELIATLNSSSAPIVVFDMHGGHSEEGIGVISLKNEAISILDIVQVARMPPIVVLSSCDTSPIDRNNYSTANAFLAGGAKTVLASALPILSDESSTFIIRLFIRLQEYLPIVIDKEKRSLQWSSFMSGMIRRTFYTEFIDHLIKTKKIGRDRKRKLNFEAGMCLDPLREEFHSHIISAFAKEMRIDESEVQRIIDEDFVLPECLKYLQYGSPERIIINSPGHIPLSQ